MTGSAGDALLVVVDMQRVFAEQDSPWCVPDFGAIIAPIEEMLGAFGRRAVFTRFLAPDVPQGSWTDYYREWSFILQPGARALLELAEPFGDRGLPVIDKTTFSAYGPEMEALMRSGGASALVLCGVSTECCVLATALAAADAGVTVRIVRDACASVDPAAHEGALHAAVVGFSPMIAVTTVAEEMSGTA